MNLDFNRRLSIAPMLDCTDRHERYFLRLLSKHILLYSEMVTTNALLHTDPDQFLRHQEFEYPAVLQLGGSNPADLAKCSKMVEESGFQEVNLNCGCPSDRVQNGNFGACLMKDKNLVADCFKAMQDAVSIPVSIKCRIGVDEFDSWEFFRDFIGTIADAGCRVFIVHARKAWLKGLSPKENREVPPLNYDTVHRLKAEMPQLNISINGGIKTLDQTLELLQDLDGVMVGREAYENPWFLRDADERIFGESKPPRFSLRKELLEAYLPYVEMESARGTPATILVRHIYGLFNGKPGARKFRQYLGENAPKTNNPAEMIRRAMDLVTEP
ncbi:tRNA dihydrouridine(20/20a) synthase DusA [Fibrobacter sp. UWB5]|uniref:tRNA dihydrouridine(20/20a) synthase DusA n=1 Tax=Fibrobacter sp. UWB5 TaxID=1964360 RepID=UPI000B526D89|nr:tRNA dihydrouridine(20/20a) synthase DusA [Fibrobacter sp. UWB5]OWV10601.1 tRNA dihydrouridine(20/20a) synthase DusA [Fibrobacter sp. UWB5]